MPNPMINPGILNRIRGSVKVTASPELNVSAQNLGREAIEFTLGGNIVEPLPVLTGVVQSPQPYIQATIRMYVLRTQSIGNQYKKRWEDNGILGDIKVYSDSSTFGDFEIYNAAITNCADMSFAGGQAGVAITITGTYYVNNSLWDL